MILSHISMVVEGVVVGFAASIPLGPIGIVCIQRTLNGNRNTGFISGLGAATADTIFAMLAVFALSYVQSFIEDKMYWFQAIAGILLMLLGFSIFLKKVRRPQKTNTQGNTSHLSNYLSVMLLTLTNPVYIGTFLLLFSALGIDGSENSFMLNLLLILGVLIGTSSWWFLLTWTINKLRKKFTIRSLWLINKISGGVIIFLGVLAIISMLFEIPSII